MPEADSEVDAFRYQIADMFARHELDRELRIPFAEDAEPTGQDQRQQERIDVYLRRPRTAETAPEAIIAASSMALRCGFTSS